MVFCCGRYRLAVADLAVADMVCGRYGRTPNVSNVMDFAYGVAVRSGPRLGRDGPACGVTAITVGVCRSGL